MAKQGLAQVNEAIQWECTRCHTANVMCTGPNNFTDYDCSKCATILDTGHMEWELSRSENCPLCNGKSFAWVRKKLRPCKVCALTDAEINLERGAQVAYVPKNADSSLLHPLTDFGFVTSKNDKFVFVRFRNDHGQIYRNSIAVDKEKLCVYRSIDQGKVDKLLERIE